MKLLARLFIFVSVFSLLSSLLIGTVHAQYAPNPYTAPNTDNNVPANMHTYTQSVLIEVMSALTCQIIGIDPTSNSSQCLGVDTATGKIGYTPSNGGAVGFFGSAISALYTPPINLPGYMKSVADDFGVVKHTYAASSNGIGFDRLSPLQGVWTTFRNLSYLVFVVIFVVIGFAVMLRVKIDPRTVMTIENQIPKIIIGLLLVTFSYAIAGFLVDMMYVTTYLTVNVLTTAQGNNAKTISDIHSTETKDLAGGNPIGFVNDIIPGGVLGVAAGSGGSVRDVLVNLFKPATTASGGGIGTSTATSALAGAAAGGAVCLGIGIITEGIGFGPCALIVGAGAVAGAGISIAGTDLPTLVSAVVGNIIANIAGILAFLIIAIAILWAMFRVWFALIGAYVGILLDTVLAPFFIIIGLLPGSKVGFGSWVRGLISNLLAFPVTIGLFLLARIFMENFATNANGIFVPPLIGNPQGSTTGQSPLSFLIALGMILLTPNVVTMTRSLLKVEENKNFGAIMQGIGAGAGAVVNTGKNVGRTLVSSRELIMKKDPATGLAEWKPRGTTTSILGTILGR